MAAGQFTLEHFKDMLREDGQARFDAKVHDAHARHGRHPQDDGWHGHRRRAAKNDRLDQFDDAGRAKNPKIIDVSRRNRISRGAGVAPAMITQLITQFSRMMPIMQMMAGAKGTGDKMAMMKQLQQSMMQDPTLGA